MAFSSAGVTNGLALPRKMFSNFVIRPHARCLGISSAHTLHTTSVNLSTWTTNFGWMGRRRWQTRIIALRYSHYVLRLAALLITNYLINRLRWGGHGDMVMWWWWWWDLVGGSWVTSGESNLSLLVPPLRRLGTDLACLLAESEGWRYRFTFESWDAERIQLLNPLPVITHPEFWDLWVKSCMSWTLYPWILFVLCLLS
jgi:hypothetical protein